MRALLLLLLCWAAPALADDHLVVLLYHHVDAQTPASTSVTPKTFEAHLDYLADEGFTVWPLGKALDVLRRGDALPSNTVSITFDDAYQSVYDEAYPRLRERGWNATLFVNSESIDRGYRNFMGWDEIRELAENGFEIGNHSHTHAHLVRRLEGENEDRWRARIKDDIGTAQRRISAEIGSEPTLFAYPFGEYSAAVRDIVADFGFTGIAQQSGAIGPDSDFLALPRFPMSTGYADLQRFATVVNARPLPVLRAQAAGEDPLDGRLASLRLDIAPGAYRASQLACFSAAGERLRIEADGEDPLRLRITLDGGQSAGRNKVNCTAPATDEPGAYFWYSYLWLVKNPDGSWYRE